MRLDIIYTKSINLDDDNFYEDDNFFFLDLLFAVKDLNKVKHVKEIGRTNVYSMASNKSFRV